MALKATHDLAVVVGTYQTSDGETKRRYENVGKIFTRDDGGTFIALKRIFNPGGVPNPDGKDMVLISQFEIREDRGERGARPRRNAETSAPAESAAKAQPRAADDDDIPF